MVSIFLIWHKHTGTKAGFRLIAVDGKIFANLHIAKLNGRICGAKRSHSVSEQPNCYQSV